MSPLGHTYPSTLTKYLVHLNILNVENRVRELRVNHVHIYHGSAPSYLHEHFSLRSSVSVQNTRASSNENFVYLVSMHVKPTPFTIRTLKTGLFYHLILNVQINRMFLKQK